MKKGYLTTLLFTASLALPGMSMADDNSHLEQVETLFKLTRMEQKSNESVQSFAQLQLRQNPNLEASKREHMYLFQLLSR